MKNNSLISLRLLLLVFTLAVSNITVKAQESNIISTLTMTPQSLDHNPALFLENKKWYLGFPFLSSVNVSGSMPWSLNKIASPTSDGSINISSSEMYKHLKKNNVIAANINLEMIRFGFKIGSNGFGHVAITERGSALINMKKNTMGFVLLGNASEQFIGKETNLSNSAISQNTYTEIALGYSHKIGSKLTVGGRFKYLIGQTNINTKRTDMSFYTDPNTYSISANTDILIRMSSPLTEDGEFRFSDLWRNGGIAFDLGATYKFLNDKLLVQASVVDLGFINWKTNVVEYRSISPDVPFAFEGLDSSIEDVLNGTNSWGVLVDSLVNSLGVEAVYGDQRYTTMLNTKLYAGATYTVVKTLDVSTLFRAKFNNKVTDCSLGIAVTYKPCDWFNLSIGNTFNSNSALGLGAGFAIRGGPFQFYLMADEISGFNIDAMKSANIRFGINFVIKDNKVNKL